MQIKVIKKNSQQPTATAAPAQVKTQSSVIVRQVTRNRPLTPKAARSAWDQLFAS